MEVIENDPPSYNARAHRRPRPSAACSRSYAMGLANDTAAFVTATHSMQMPRTVGTANHKLFDLVKREAEKVSAFRSFAMYRQACLRSTRSMHATFPQATNLIVWLSTRYLQGNFVLTLGGDHSMGAGTVCGILTARPDTAVIWVVRHRHFRLSSRTMAFISNLWAQLI